MPVALLHVHKILMCEGGKGGEATTKPHGEGESVFLWQMTVICKFRGQITEQQTAENINDKRSP